MSDPNVQKQIREYVVENFLVDEEEEDLKDDTSFLDSGLIDSTGMLEVITFMEDTWAISVDDEEMVPENLDSVVNLTRFVERKLAKGA